MMRLQLSLKWLGFGLCLAVLAPSSTQAYLDPGTGSYIFQLIIAGLLGGLFALKTWWRSIKSFFTKVKRNETRGGVTKEDDIQKND